MEHSKKKAPKNAKDERDNYPRYSYSLMTYAKPEEFARLLKVAKHWAWIFHNRDNKEPHYHIYVSFVTKKSPKQILEIIDSKQNTFWEGMKGTPQDLLTYFTHEKEVTKAQYEYSEIQFDDEKYWSKGADAENKENENQEFLEHLLKKTSRREMARKYGKDYMKNYRAYEEFANMLQYEELRELEKSLEGVPAELDDLGQVVTVHAEITQEEYEQLLYYREINSIKKGEI